MEPTPRHSRQVIAASLVAALAIGVTGFLLGREVSPAAEPVRAVQPEPKPTPGAAAAPEERSMSRAELLDFATAAADRAASATPLPPRFASLAGKRFDLSLPFGCDGPVPAGMGALGWRYDADASALRIRVVPVSWAVTQWFPSRPAGLSALEGFWVARPWSSRETCAAPAAAPPPGAEPVTLAGQTLGLAQLISDDGPRHIARADEPYETVIRVKPEALQLGSGLRLRLQGRFENHPGGDSARCVQPGGPDQRPICLIAVSFDELAVINPETEETLATWSPSAPSRAD